MPRPAKGERVLGPYRVASGWRIDHYDGRRGDDGRPSKPVAQVFAREAQAQAALEGLQRQIDSKVATSVAAAIDEYETHLRDAKGNKPKSVKETVRRLRVFFGIDADDDGGTVATLTHKQCAAKYDQLAGRLSVDSHRNYLAESRTFLAWCCARRWLRANPLDGVQGRGRRKHGKVQLTIDEARKWELVALQQADQGEAGAVAALASLYMGLRAGELVAREVRDVDDGCSVLWIRAAKTQAGERRVAIPSGLRPYFQVLTEGRPPGAWLFPGRYAERGGHRDAGWVTDWVSRLCTKAGVREVCAHSMRGLHATLAETAGQTSEAVARALGHESIETTHESYAAASAVDEAKQRRAMGVLQGGRKP